MRDLRSDLISAPPYEVLLLEEDPRQGEDHRHVIAVQTNDPDGGQTRWATLEAIAAMKAGEVFIVGDGAAPSPGRLEPATCPACAAVTISVSPGGTEVSPR